MPKKYKDVLTDSPTETDSTTAAAVAKLNEDIPESQRARPASEDSRGMFEAAASEAGIDKKAEAQSVANTLRNKLLVFLEKSRDQTASLTRILHETGASRDALTKVLTREKNVLV